MAFSLVTMTSFPLGTTSFFDPVLRTTLWIQALSLPLLRIVMSFPNPKSSICRSPQPTMADHICPIFFRSLYPLALSSIVWVAIPIESFSLHGNHLCSVSVILVIPTTIAMPRATIEAMDGSSSAIPIPRGMNALCALSSSGNMGTERPPIIRAGYSVS